eukprot:813082-Pelagomonas_calceolata.AAC.1
MESVQFCWSNVILSPASVSCRTGTYQKFKSLIKLSIDPAKPKLVRPLQRTTFVERVATPPRLPQDALSRHHSP